MTKVKLRALIDEETGKKHKLVNFQGYVDEDLAKEAIAKAKKDGLEGPSALLRVLLKYYIESE